MVSSRLATASFQPPGVEDGDELPVRCQRLATEAGGALVTWALRQHGVRAVVASCDRDNMPSVRTLERLGFTRTGERDGAVHWRLDRMPRRRR